MQLKFGDKREKEESKRVPCPTCGRKKGKRKGKNGIGPRMKNGRANHKQNRAFTNGGYSITCHLIMMSQLSALAGGLSFKKAESYYCGDLNITLVWDTPFERSKAN